MNFICVILQIVTENVDNNDRLLTIVSAVAAIASALYAFRSNVIAKRAYRLAMQEYNDRQSNFALYLIDGYRWTSKNESKRKFLLFHVTVTNKSENKNSFKSDLEIEYVRTDQSVARALVVHDPALTKFIPQREFSTFSADIKIEEKSIDSKWLIFEQPKDVFKEYRIEKYTLRLTDTVGRTEFIESVLLKELNNEEEKD